MPHVITGAERVLASPPTMLQGRKLGLLANPSSVTRSLASIATRMFKHPQLHLTALYGPEHGVRGNAQAGDHVDAAVDPATGLPVFSLYGDTRIPTAAMLDPIEVMAIDLQDIGVRYATYLSTVAHVLDACAVNHVDVVVLDRPNPLGGATVAGNRLDPTFGSFVGCQAMPIRHGLTIGEFARLYARNRGLPDPDVIRMDGWSRDFWFDQCELPWILPSPNLPTLDSVTVYPATCLIEGTNLSEGRGTTRPFEFVGAPWINADRFAKELRDLALEGVLFRPAWFQPTFSKHAGSLCGGVQVHVVDRTQCDTVALGVHLLAILRRMSPEDFGWLPPHDGRYFVDLLAGTDRLRTTIDKELPVSPLLAEWEHDAAQFHRERSDILLY